MKYLIQQSLIGKIVVLLTIVWVSSARAENCTDKDYKIFKAYDSYLDANPQMDDDTARRKFAAGIKMNPAALKSLYFNCLFRWKDEEPAAAKKAAQAAIAEMAAGGESPLTKGHNCKTLGFRYGDTATRAMLGRKPNLGWDFVMPERCKNNSITDAAIKDGVKNASR